MKTFIIEVRAKLPGTGNWAAFWLNGKRDENFPISNEVDVFEVFGNTDKITSTIYAWTGNEATNRKVIEADTTLTEDILNEYHTYGCELTDTGVTIYVDGVVVTNVLFENCEADAVSYLKNGGAMDILLGNSTGYDKINEFNFIQGEPTASTFEIDYIRLYK